MWRRRTFSVEERGYFASGEVAEMNISRDFEGNARWIERISPSLTFREWVSPRSGWVEWNGERRIMDATELASELYGLRQEPYTIYHRIALRDPALRFELRDNGVMLMVYDGDERVLCWFRRAANGRLRGWGNFYDGAINEHYYGPTADMGDADLPRWGSSIDGRFRFEYVSARLRDTPLREPVLEARQ